MLATRAVVHNYWSVVNDCELVIDPRVSVLVGATESGKTNVLRALASFSGGEYRESDLCSRSSARRGPKPEMPIVTVEFQAEGAERERLEKAGVRLDIDGRFRVTRFFGGEYGMPGRDDMRPLSAQFRSKIAAIFDGAKHMAEEAYGSRGIDFSDARAAMEGVRSVALSVVDAPDINRWNSIRDDDVPRVLELLRPALSPEEMQVLEEYFERVDSEMQHMCGSAPSMRTITGLLPQFIYVPGSPQGLLEGRYALYELQAATLGSDQRLDNALRLLQLGDIEVRELLTSDPEQRERRLGEAGGRITRALRGVWSQGGQSGGPPPISLQLRVGEGELRVMVATEGGHDGFPETRSEGFRWYLTFYLSYALSVAELGRSGVLLFDEPGIYLHPMAQRDLLSRFNEMADHTQVVFSTHLCDLVDLARPESWRLIQMGGSGYASTVIENQAWRSADGRVGMEVISKALYGHAGLGLPHWPLNLIVEGPSDQVILDAVARVLSERGASQYSFLFNGTIRLIVAHGLRHYKTYLTITKRPGDVVVALFDSDAEGDKKRDELIRGDVVTRENSVCVNDGYGSSGAHDIEDLLGFELYRDAVLSAYQGTLPQGFTFKRPPQGSGKGMGKRIQNIFETGAVGTDALEFDKLRVANALKDLIIEKHGRLRDESRQRFSRLFDEIRQRLYPE